jgi:hypothetical protein
MTMFFAQTALSLFNKSSTAADPSGQWETNRSRWPVRDKFGNWLVLAETERRLLENGRYEYRVALGRDR